MKRFLQIGVTDPSWGSIRRALDALRYQAEINGWHIPDAAPLDMERDKASGLMMVRVWWEA